MNPRQASRTQDCGAREARARLRDARAQLALAELATAASTPEARKAASSFPVLAGIAAADAVCCSALGRRSRSQNHRDAVALVRQVFPAGPAAARHLERLLGLKDQAQYGFEDLTGQQLTVAMRQARALITLAESTVAR